MVRNAGKFGKPKRGGKKQFTQDLRPLDDGEDNSGGSSEEEDSEEEGSDESGGDAEDQKLSSKLAATSIGGSSSSPQATTAETRAARKAAKKKAAGKSSGGKNAAEDGKSDDDDDEEDGDLANPNHAVQKQVKVSEISKVAASPMNRKEREAVEKKAAQERYRKLHLAGKTDEAKVDLARLAQIRKEREQAAAFRKAEAEAKAKEAADKAALSGRKKK